MTDTKHVLVLLMLLLSSIAFCQHGQSFIRLGVNEGVSQNSVREIFQDSQGFIWIGTGDGLNRFDGKQIKKYRESFRDKSAKILPGKVINGKITQDNQQNLWMLVDGQLVKMNLPTETFTQIKKIGRDLDCNILGINKNQIYSSSPQGVFATDIHKGTTAIIPLFNVFDLYTPTASDAQLLYLKENNIYSYNLNKKTSTLLITMGNKKITYPVICNNTELLFSTAEHIYTYNLSTRKIKAAYAIPYNKNLAHQIKTKTHNGNIIAILPNKGFAIIDIIKGTYEHYTSIENSFLSLSSNLIYTAVVDHSNNLWLGTEGGGISLLNLKPSLFDGFPEQAIANKQSSLLMVKSIYHDNGDIYIGTYSKGLQKINRFTREHKTLFQSHINVDKNFNGIYFIKKDDRGKIWMNVGNQIGIANLNKETFIASIKVPYERKSKRHNIPQCFIQVSPNKYIAGTYLTTYLIEDNNGKLSYTDLGIQNKILEDDIQSLYLESNGNVIIGKGEGKGYVRIHITNTNKVQIIEKGLDNLTIKFIYRDELRKAYWFATNVGIIIKPDQTDKLEIIDEADGISNDFIYSIIPENNYSFWISTNKGLSKVTLKKGNKIAVESVEQYGIQHGLQSNEFNTGAYYKEGHVIFFGGVTGINWFDERKFFKRKFYPRSYITNLFVNEKPYHTDTSLNYLKAVKLRYDENNIFLKFATLDYTNPNVNQYQYTLSGYDKSWITAYNIPEARYSKLPHGNYALYVKTANSEGVWSDAQQMLRITITPPFWLTWWFKTFSLLSALAIAFFSIKYLIERRLKKQLQIIEKQLAVNNERLRISKDMHDEFGTGLSKIALLSEVGKNQRNLAGNDKIINEISLTSKNLANKMGEIIWTLNPQNDTLGNLAAYIHEYISDTTEALPIEVKFQFPDNIPNISIGHFHRQQIMLVTKEALNNALKYSKATTIFFSISAKTNQILFSLKDDGTGFLLSDIIPHKNGKRNGLSNMRERMESIGGHFSIITNKGYGTEINYSINN